MNRRNPSVFIRFCLGLVAGCTGWMPVSAPRAGAAPEAVAPPPALGRHLSQTDAATPPLLLAEAGRAQAEIVCARYSPVAAFAARELKRFLDEATGADFQIVPARTGGQPAICVGDSPWTRAWGVDVGGLARDGFIIRRVGDAIVIAGRDDPWTEPEKAGSADYERSTLFGVYDFLERFVGVRFFFPGPVGTVVPKSSVLRIPAIDILEEPDFPMRTVLWSGAGARWHDESSAEEQRRHLLLESLRLRGQTQTIPNCHGLARLGYLERFGQDHPDYFALHADGKRGNDPSRPGHPGQLCHSNTNLLNEVYRDAEAYLLGKPAQVRGVLGYRRQPGWDPSAFQPGYFNAMPQDGLQACHCPACHPFFKSGRAGELIWRFVVDVARRLKHNGIPGYVTTMAYVPYLDVPKIEIPDNLLVMVATMGPWGEKYPALQSREDQLIRDWHAKLGHRVWLWNYINNYNGRIPPGVAPLSTAWIADYYKRHAPHLTGAFLETEIDVWLFQYLNYYVFMKVAWDVNTDRDALMADHNRSLFGPAAEPMGRFFEKLETWWTEELIGEFKNTSLGPTFVAPSGQKTWEHVFHADRIRELEACFGDAERLAARDADALKRVAFFRDRFYGEMLRERERHAGVKHEIEDLTYTVLPAPEAATIRVDGALDEPAWAAATPVDLVNAVADQPAKVRTVVRALWSPAALHLGFDCEEPRIADMAFNARLRDDPEIWKDASIEVFLNPANDRAGYFQIIVNAAGAMTDIAYRRENGAAVRDVAWDSQATAAVRVAADKWTVELALPWKTLEAAGRKAGDELVANFNRTRIIRGGAADDNQHYSWSPFIDLRAGGFHKPDRFGRLQLADATE